MGVNSRIQNILYLHQLSLSFQGEEIRRQPGSLSTQRVQRHESSRDSPT